MRECHRHGLNEKQAAVLLWRQRMDEMLERPSFRTGFFGELQKRAEDPGILSQIDASLADQGGLGANLSQYGGAGVGVGGALGLGAAGLALLSKRRALMPALSGAEKMLAGSKGLSRKFFSHPVDWAAGGPGAKMKAWVTNPIKGLMYGSAAGGVAGLGYGAKKTYDNSLLVPIGSMGLAPNKVPQMTGQTPEPVLQQRDPYSMDGGVIADGTSQASGSAEGALPSRGGAASDFVRMQQHQLGGLDKRIEALQQQRAAAGAAGSQSGSRAMTADIDQQIMALSKARNESQQQMNDTLRNLQMQQEHLNSSIAQTVPRVNAFGAQQGRMADAAAAMHKNHGLMSSFLNWISGRQQNYDPTMEYARRQDAASALQQHYKQLQAHPPLYTDLA